MFSFYETLNTEELSHITFVKESAYGDGVTREVYSQFFKELFALKSSGVESNVPYSLTVTEARALGKLMIHAFIQSNFFPLNFAKATFEYLARSTVRNSSLIESFLFFIQKKERAVFTNFLYKKSESFSPEDKDIIWDVLIDCGVSAIPNPTNIKELVLQAARAVFIEKPCFTLLHISEGLGNIFKSLGQYEIDALYTMYRPTMENALAYFEWEAGTPSEERVESYFKRYVRSLDENQLSSLIQFATGSSNVEPDSFVKVEYVNQDSRCFMLRAAACFKVTYVPRNIEVYKQFTTMVEIL